MDGAAEPPHDSTNSSTWQSADTVPPGQHADPEDTSLTADTLSPMPRLLVVHLRLGTFSSTVQDSAGWQGSNETEGRIDQYTPPLGGLQPPADHAEFGRHCWPSIDDVMQHVRRVREEWEEGLRGRIERGMKRSDPDGGHYTNETEMHIDSRAKRHPLPMPAQSGGSTQSMSARTAIRSGGTRSRLRSARTGGRCRGAWIWISLMAPLD
ncbi:hypothetical protein JB92DRAFT_1289411 [Gautieria morchelliformis]|nr:hypothetical protein JB92DRAFT_1289411 [Gautieria morchelliformis]